MNIDRSRGEDIDLIFILQQSRIVPRERLRSSNDAFVTTLNDDCDFVHINPPRARTKSSVIRSLLKCSSYLRRPINPKAALSASSWLR